jgi:hypothetical protein
MAARNGVVRHANADEHDRKTFARLSAKTRTLRDRGRQAIVRQAGRRKQGQLLATHQAVHQVDRRDAGFNEVPGQGAPRRIDAHAVDPKAAHGWNRGVAVERTADAIEDAAEHVGPDAHAQRFADYGNSRVGDAQPGGRFEYLDDHPVFFERRNPPEARTAVTANNLQRFVDADIDTAAHEEERALNPLCQA